MTETARVIIVGAGIFGVTAALALRRRGYSVVLLDAGPPPHPDASSTDISKVIRADYGSDAFYVAQMERALPRWRAWNDGWPRPLFHETGVVFATEGPMREGSFEAESFALLSDRGFALERLDGGALQRRFGAWSESFTDGYFNPRGGWAQSGAVVATLAEEAREAGVDVRAARVTGLRERGGRVVGAETEAGVLEADAVVIAAGAWSVGLVPALASRVRTIGQPVLHFAPADPAPFRAPRLTPFGADISRTGFYGFCANADDVVKVAHHGPGFDVALDGPRALPQDAEARFRAFLGRALPGLADAPKVSERVCLYSDSRDGDLFIDRHPDREGLVVATGGSGHAFKLAPLLGDWIADAVEGRTVPRFAWRTIDEERTEQARHIGTHE